MANTLIIGYGGFGAGCVRSYSRLFSWPAVILDTHEVEQNSDEVYLDLVELSSDETLDSKRLCNIMSGYRNILLVSSLGGESFSYAYQRIINSARSLDLPVISLCTMPYIFETDRRSRAIDNLKVLSGSASNLFIIDSQKTIQEDCAPGDFLEKTKGFLVNTMKILINLLECGPFYSYCSDPIYTLALGSAPILTDAIHDALDRPLFDLKSISGKVLICADAVADSTEMDEITSYLVQRCSALPEFIGKAGMGDHDVIIFVPISFRQHE